MITGVIYKYTSPSGKVYIGQTTNEVYRRKCWNSSDPHYAGTKIDRARAKYGRDKFCYEVIHSKLYNTREEAIMELNRLERYYIGLYDSYKAGYNCTMGGEGVLGTTCPNHVKDKLRRLYKGRKLAESTIEKIRATCKEKFSTVEWREQVSKASKGRKNPKSIKAMILARQKSVQQISLDGKLIREYPSIREALYALGIEKRDGNITAVCRGRRKTAYGYIWKYKNMKRS